MLTLKALVYVEAEVKEELKGLRDICERFRRKGVFDEVSARRDFADEFVLRGVAGMLQDYYSGAERIFKRIALEIDERLPKGENWHKMLLDQMKIEVPGVRPAVLSRATYDLLDEFRSFRHKVGNIYGFNLIPERVLAHVLSLPQLHSALENDIEMFFATVKQTVQDELDRFGDPKNRL